MKKGNLSVEFVFIVTLWSFFLIQFLSLTHMSLVRQRIQSLVRLGALVGSAQGMSTEILNQTIDDYQAQLSIPADADVAWTYERFLDTPASRFYDLWESKAVVEWKKSGSFTETMVIQKEGEL